MTTAAQSVSVFSRAAQSLLGLLALASALGYLWTFPIASSWLVVGSVVYFALLLRKPDLWLWVVPIALPVLNLTPWSGRIFLDEFDALLLVSLAGILARGHYRIPKPFIRNPLSLLLIGGFIACYLSGTVRGLLPITDLTPNSFNSYYSNFNSLRVAKGMFWAIVFTPIFTYALQQDRAQTIQRLAQGLFIGAAGLIVVILWERGVVHDLLYWSNRYALLESLLDFSSRYRVTGLFADMHTGGTAIDGYLSLIWPFGIYVLLKTRSRIGLITGIAITAGILYAIAVTFSRGLYLGFGVGLVAATLLWLSSLKSQVDRKTLTLAAALVLIGLSLCAAAFRFGGTFTLAITLLAISSFSILPRVKRPALGNTVLIFIAGVALFTALITYTSMGSKWTDYELSFALWPSLLISFLAVSIGRIASHQFLYKVSLQQKLALLIFICVVLGTFIPGTLGYRMQERFSTVGADLLHRIDHWTHSADLMLDGTETTLLGEGIGRFPHIYRINSLLNGDVGGGVIIDEGDNRFLRYSGAYSSRTGQRLFLEPNTDYTLSYQARTNDNEVPLRFRLCHRHLIYPSEWNSNCIDLSSDVSNTNGRWLPIQIEFNTGKLASLQLQARSPLTLTVSNHRVYRARLRDQTSIDIDNIALAGADGQYYLGNGDFQQNMDEWFTYYDFDHLPWHIKNIWVHTYFELGLAGLLSFVLLVCLALARSARAAKHGDLFALAVFTGLLGFLLVGTFGTLVDAPRIGFLFYFLLFFASMKSYSNEPLNHSSLRGT